MRSLLRHAEETRLFEHRPGRSGRGLPRQSGRHIGSRAGCVLPAMRAQRAGTAS
jgi:hypothetical protein